MSEVVMVKLRVDGFDLRGWSDLTTHAGEDLSDYIRARSWRFGLSRAVRPGGSLVGNLSVDGVPSFEVVKRVDAATPLLAQAIARGQTCAVVVKVFGTAADGSDQLEFTATLTDARLSRQELFAGAPSYKELNLPTAAGTYERLEFGWATIHLEWSGSPTTESEITWSLSP